MALGVRGPLLLALAAVGAGLGAPSRAEPPAAPATRTERARAACEGARRALRAARRADGSWEDVTDIGGGLTGLCLVGWRVAGGLGEPDGERVEAEVLRHLLRTLPPDGGVPPYPGAAPSPAATRWVRRAVRLALGAEPGGRAGPVGGAEGWRRANGALDLATRLRLQDLERRLAALGTEPAAGEEPPLAAGPGEVLAAWLEGDAATSARVRASLALLALAARRVAAQDGQGHRVFERFAPALHLLAERAGGGTGDVTPWRRALEASQDDTGGWLYNAPLTALALAALVAGGLPADAPPVRRGRASLRAAFPPVADGERGLDAMRSDLWNTSQAVLALLAEPEARSTGPDVRPSLEHLLREQSPEGGWAWARGAAREWDNDSTALVVRALVAARPTADAPLAARLEAALARARALLARTQGPHGGWSVWGRSLAAPVSLPPAPHEQLLRDAPTPDLTARVLQALLDAGAGLEDGGVRAALRLLLDLQQPEGGWWCRWWAGFLAGTAMALEALAALPPPTGPEGAEAQALRADAAAAVSRAQALLLARQHADGGWGETLGPDPRAAHGREGPGTPLHTSCVLAALLRSGLAPRSAPCLRAVDWPLAAQAPGADGAASGTWTDLQATFTLYAGAAYYPFPFAAQVLPLDALRAWLARLAPDGG